MADAFPGRLSDESTNHADDEALALLGKKQVLERRFSFVSMFAFAVCELITWETVLALFSEAFENGGPAGVVYGFMYVRIAIALFLRLMRLPTPSNWAVFKR